MCTNKLEWWSRRLDALGLLRPLRRHLRSRHVRNSKPDLELLRRTIARAAGDAACAVMVGDLSPTSPPPARQGVPVVGVDYGHTETPVAELGPDRVISALPSCLAAVVALLGAANQPNLAGRR